jgi:hypothetical protein
MTTNSYWDFSRDPSLPAAVKTPTIDIFVPGASAGQKKRVTLDHNPLYSYKFTSNYAWNIMLNELEWNQRNVSKTTLDRIPQALKYVASTMGARIEALPRSKWR